MLNDEQLAEAIYEGDFEQAKETLDALSKKVGFLSDVGFKMPSKTNQHAGQSIDFLPLVFLAESDHPGDFAKYRPFVQAIIQHDGLSKVVSRVCKGPCLNNLLLWRNDIKKFEVPISQRMKGYLHFLRVRDTRERKLANAILGQLNTSTGTPLERETMWQAKCAVVRAYRAYCPKGLEQ